MLEWELIVERIQALIQADNPAGKANEGPPENKGETLFQRQMNDLGEHLERLYAILTNADDYAMEELADAFCRASGKAAGYHRFVHNDDQKEVPDKASQAE